MKSFHGLILIAILVIVFLIGISSFVAFGELDYNQTLCSLEFECYTCGPLDENVCILGKK